MAQTAQQGRKKLLFIKTLILVLLLVIIVVMPLYLLSYPDYVHGLVIRCCVGYAITFNCYMAYFFVRVWFKARAANRAETHNKQDAIH